MIAAPTVVLCYHRIADDGDDPHGLTVAPDVFGDHLDAIRAHAAIVPLEETTRWGRRPRVALTFDDGYADNATTAVKVLEEAGAPATFFITTGLLGSESGTWWDRLAAAMAATPVPHLELVIGGRPLWADARTPEARARAHAAVHRRLLDLPADEIDAVIREIPLPDDADRPDDVPREVPPFMTTDELEELAQVPGVSIGAHTISHPKLSARTEAEQRAEIAGGKARLEALVGPVRTLAYPFGGADTFDATTERIAAEAGFAMACTTVPGRVTPRTPRTRVPRHLVGPWDAAELTARLTRWLRD